MNLEKTGFPIIKFIIKEPKTLGNFVNTAKISFNFNTTQKVVKPNKVFSFSRSDNLTSIFICLKRTILISI